MTSSINPGFSVQILYNIERGGEIYVPNQLQTMSKAFSEICQGERPWTALGNFMNYWYEYAKDRRETLIADPLPAYDEHNIEQHQRTCRTPQVTTPG